jgi:hypothetical protein
MRGGLRSVPDHRDRWVRRHFVLKCIDVMHSDNGVNGVATRHQVAEIGAVLIVHPPVGTNEPKGSVGFQKIQSDFEKSYVHIASSAHCGTSSPVCGGYFGGYTLEANVRRIPNNEVSGSMFVLG